MNFDVCCIISIKFMSSDHLPFWPQYLTLQRSLRRNVSVASSPEISLSTLQWCRGSNRTATSSDLREVCWAALLYHKCRQSSLKGL